MKKHFPYHWINAFWLVLLCSAGYLSIGAQLPWFPASGFGVAQAQTSANTPTLIIPSNLSVTTGATIAVPVAFAANNSGVVATIFSLDFDQRCLAFDTTDSNSDGVPDAITFAALPAHSPSVSYNPADTDGELDFAIADYQTPLDALPAAVTLVTVTLRASCLPPPGQSVQAGVGFSTSPRLSFSNAQGRDVSGSAQDGLVTIFAALSAPTTTPTASATTSPTATPTLTASATATATTTGNATATATTTATTTVTSTVTSTATTASPSATSTPTGNAAVTPSPTPTPTPTATLIPTAPPTIDITDRALEAGDDLLTTDEDQPVTFRPLDNDTAADGDTVTLVALGEAHLGTLTFVDQETVQYTPAKDAFGTDPFLYFVRDQQGKEATGLVTVLINPVNDPPTIAPIGNQRHQVGDLVLLPVAIGDVDTPLAALTYAISGLPPGLNFNSSTQQIQGAVSTGATGVYPVSITVSDGALPSTVQFEWTVLAAGQTAQRRFLPLIINDEASGKAVTQK